MAVMVARPTGATLDAPRRPGNAVANKHVVLATDDVAKAFDNVNIDSVMSAH